MRDCIKHPGYKYLKIGYGPPVVLIRWHFCLEKQAITRDGIERIISLPGFPLKINARDQREVKTTRLFVFLKERNAKARRLLGLPKRGRT